MIVALVMAGGRASRLGGAAKPLLRVCGDPMLARVIRAAQEVTPHVVVAVAGRAAGETARLAHDLLADSVWSPGLGYAVDLPLALRVIGRNVVLVLPSDTPFITGSVLRQALSMAAASEASVVTVEGCQGPLGLSVVKAERWSSWSTVRIGDCRALLDVDTLGDLAEALAGCDDASKTPRG